MAKKKAARRRGRNGKLNKSQAIRDALAVLGADAAPKDVIARLAKKKIDVSPAHVSNVKAALAGRRNGGRVSLKRGDVVSVSSLVAAKELVNQAGGLTQARKVLDAIDQIG